MTGGSPGHAGPSGSAALTGQLGLAGPAGRVGQVVAVVGPTAAGKSALAVSLALALGGEVINADSMQLYRGMDIGTAKLTAQERRGVPHHLLDIWDVRQAASVADYQRLARAVNDDVAARGRVPILAGGSGLYIRGALGDLNFPGETEQDFSETLDVVREARFAGAFTFLYSPRRGTPAATMDAQVPPEVVQERYDRLVAVVGDVTLAENQRLVGVGAEVLVAEGEGRKDAATHRMSGRARDNRLVHFTPQGTSPRPGDVVTVTITRAAPHYLVADGAPRAVRRTRAGDAWESRQGRDHTTERDLRGTPGESGASRPGPVALGMPALSRPV